MTKIRIQQWSAPLDYRRGTILDTALNNGVPYPHSCRSGECGNCKTRVLSGEVQLDPYDPSALSELERQSGIVLACRCRPKTDLDIAWLADMVLSESQPVQSMVASVVCLEPLTHDITRLRLSMQGSPLAFNAGQYAMLRFRDLPPRPYSMANRPDEPELEFHIRRIPDGRTSNHVATHLQMGDAVRLEGPFGSAYLRGDRQAPILAIAGGSGLAPILSIVGTALRRPWDSPIEIYLGVRDERDVYGETELSMFAARYRQIRADIVLSHPGSSTARRTGFLHEAVAADRPDLRGTKLYVAGPPPMVDAVTRMALANGASDDDIHCDPFSFTAPGAVESGDRPGRMKRLASVWRALMG